MAGGLEIKPEREYQKGTADMANIPTKASFGTVAIDHFSPPIPSPLPPGVPPALNITVSFEEALKLHIGLLQILGKLNTYKRSTTAGRKAAVNLCLFLDTKQITINEDSIK